MTIFIYSLIIICNHNNTMFRGLSAAEVVKHSQELENNDYTLIKQVFTDPDFFLDRIQFPDPNPIRGPCVSGPESQTMINKTLDELQSTIQQITPYTIGADYGFAMNYVEGSSLRSHYDNFNNLISCTAVYKSEKDVYPIFLDKAKFSNPYPFRLVVDDVPGIPPQNVARIDIDAGDIGVFKGRYHLHWRNKAPKGTETRAMLLHYNRLRTHYVPRNVNITYERDPIPRFKAHPTPMTSYAKFRTDYDMYFSESLN